MGFDEIESLIKNKIAGMQKASSMYITRKNISCKDQHEELFAGLANGSFARNSFSMRQSSSVSDTRDTMFINRS
jgi:hypothetical protein